MAEEEEAAAEPGRYPSPRSPNRPGMSASPEPEAAGVAEAAVAEVEAAAPQGYKLAQ